MPDILYEDNHIIAVYKRTGDIIQKDKTGDKPLSEKVKSYLKEKYHKKGNVFLGVTHRIDRPVSGVVIFAKTSKALMRLNKMFLRNEIHKTYWAIVKKEPPADKGKLVHWLKKNEKQNKSYVVAAEEHGAKKAILEYVVIGKSENYFLLSVKLLTGRHHQIRCQLANIGCPVRGDLKYGFPRSNQDKGIDLLAKEIRFIHPVSGNDIKIQVPIPDNKLWQAITKNLRK
ncbi:MAG TPA: RluA family pseudouridine synthase [Bacteroidales bacterium]|nr:RluA family pseudouridine synthase [Bacteroidales bacterium]